MRLLPAATAVVVVSAASVAAFAEGVAPEPKGASTGKRIRGAGFLKPLGEGIVSVGGTTLRYLGPGAHRWRTLHQQKGNLYRLGLDPEGGRLLAFWEHDELLHYFDLGQQLHAKLPLPTTPPPPNARFFEVDSLSFAPDGRDALIYMAGPTRGAGPVRASRAYRARLEAPDEPELLFEVPIGGLLWTSPRGAIYDLPEGRRPCLGCLESALYAFDVTDSGVEKRRLFGRPQPPYRSVKVVTGSSPDRLVMFMLTGRGMHAFLRYRWGDDQPLYQDLPPGPGPRGGVLAPNADEVVYVVDRDVELDVVRRALPPDVASTTTRLWLPWKLLGEGRTQPIYGMGVRHDGTAWLHLGDDMALVDARGVARRTSVRAFVRDRRVEWAGADLYVKKPEGLWIGVEVGSSRDFVWVSFADLERKARPWPVRDPRVPLRHAPPRPQYRKCLPPETRIATPTGEVAVSGLVRGMTVWTQDGNGERVIGTIVATSRVRVGEAHEVVRLRLADGRALSVSAGHPLPGGRAVEELRTGGHYDGSVIAGASLEAYAGTETYDLLPSGPTGVYWANGIPLGSTLTPRVESSSRSEPTSGRRMTRKYARTE